MENQLLEGNNMLNPVFDRFVKKSPISVMARGLMENILSPEQLDEWFERTATDQYTKELLFSTVFDIMSQVVLGSRKSVHAAYQASEEEISVSVTSLYNKLNCMDIQTSAELVRFASNQVVPIIETLGGPVSSPLPGFHIKLLDGNCIEKSEHRIKELRVLAAGPLPGKSLVVYDPALRVPIDVFPCEDGHAQERSLLAEVLLTIKQNDVWIADRNFCVLGFTFGIISMKAHFIIREHKNYPFELLEEEEYVGKTDTGEVYEQRIKVVDGSGDTHIFRRIRVNLKKETRDGDKDIFIICSLPKDKADARLVAELYRGRWTIETSFQELSENLNSEINTLGYPKAALFGFCIALISYMIIAVVKAALASVHGKETVDNISGYYLADEISGTYRGMMIAVPEDEWIIFRTMDTAQLSELLKTLSENVKLSAFRKHPRGVKKPPPKRKKNKKSPHVSTAKILAKRKKT